MSADRRDLLTGPQLDRYLGISHTTRWRWVRSGVLPEPYVLSATAKRWDRAEIDARLDQRRSEVA